MKDFIKTSSQGNKTNFVINNATTSKVIMLTIFIAITFTLFFISSFKTNLSCIDNKCTIIKENLLGKTNKKSVLLENGKNFYCKEYKHRHSSRMPYHDDYFQRSYWVKDYILSLYDQSILTYNNKEDCLKELSQIDLSMINNKTFEKEYEDISLNILLKSLGIFFAFFTIIISISKIDKIHIQIQNK